MFNMFKRRQSAPRVVMALGFFLFGTAPWPAQAAREFDSAASWQTIETPHFEFHYSVGLEAVANKLAQQAEPIHDRLSLYFKWVPREKTQVIVADQWDYVNGSASSLPFNQILVHVAPSSDVDGLEDNDDSLARVFQHEYVHILHLDKAVGPPERLRHFVGRFFPFLPLLFPNHFEPTWIVEGLATYMETDQERGVGRGQSTYFRMLMRNELINGFKSLDALNQPLVTWPGGTARYVYGVYFFNFLHDRYGDAYIQNFVENYSSNLMPFMLNSTAMRTFGQRDFYTLWREFETYLHQQFDAEIERAKQTTHATGTALTDLGLHTGRSRVAADGSIYYLRADGEQLSALMRFDSQHNRHDVVSNVSAAGQFDWHPSAGLLVVQGEVSSNTNFYFDLFQIDPATGTSRRLTTAGRYSYAAWSPDGSQIAAIKLSAGKHQLELLDANGQIKEVVWQDENVLISSIDWAPDGLTFVASVRRLDQWNLELFDLKKKQWHALTHGSSIKAQPQFSADGTSIIYIDDENGTYNAYQFDLASGSTQQITHEIGGAFYPSLSADKRTLFYSSLNAKGFDLYRLTMRAPESVAVKPDLTVDAAQASSAITAPAYPTRNDVSSARPYSGLSRLRPTWWLPGIGFGPDSTTLALITSGHDPLSWHTYAVALSVESEHGNTTWDINYSYDRWFPTLSLFLNRSNSIGLFKDSNITAEIETHDSLTAVVQLPFVSVTQQKEIYFGASYNYYHQSYRDSLGPAAADGRDGQWFVGAKYNSARKLPKAVYRQAGFQAQGSFDSNIGESENPGNALAATIGYFTPLFWRSVVELRGLGAIESETAKPYRLGFDSGQIFDPIGNGSATLANKRSFDLHGYPSGLAALRGNTLQFGSADWHFPLGWFETGTMSPPLGVTRAKGNVFTEAARIWSSQNPGGKDTWYRSVGAEVAAEFTLGYRFQIEATLGIAKGLDTYGETQSYGRLTFQL